MLTKSLSPTAIFSRDDVRGAFAILGLDPLYLANEGRFVAIVAAADANHALQLLADLPSDHAPALIGHVNEAPCSRGVQLSTIGACLYSRYVKRRT